MPLAKALRAEVLPQFCATQIYTCPVTGGCPLASACPRNRLGYVQPEGSVFASGVGLWCPGTGFPSV